MATLTIEHFPDALRERLARQARRNRRSLDAEARALLEQALAVPPSSQKATGALERHFGAVDLGPPAGTDDEQIDADAYRPGRPPVVVSDAYRERIQQVGVWTEKDLRPLEEAASRWQWQVPDW